MAESSQSKSPAPTGPVAGPPLLVPAGNYEGKPSLKLAKPVILVGAKADCHLHLLSSTVSQHHAVLLTCSDGVLVRDLASRTRTLINGKPAHERKLEDGDELQIGKFTFRYDANGSVPGPERVAPEFQIVPENEAPIPLNKRVLVIGRRSTCDVSLVEESCSTTHALLMNIEGKWVIRDLASRTGTRVNGGAIRVKELVDGDVIRVGETDLRFERVHEIVPAVTDEDLDVGGATESDELLAVAGEPGPFLIAQVVAEKVVPTIESAPEVFIPPQPVEEPTPEVVSEALPTPESAEPRAPIDETSAPVELVAPRIEAQSVVESSVSEDVVPESRRPRRGWRAMGIRPEDDVPGVVEQAEVPSEPILESSPTDAPAPVEPLPQTLVPKSVVEQEVVAKKPKGGRKTTKSPTAPESAEALKPRKARGKVKLASVVPVVMPEPQPTESAPDLDPVSIEITPLELPSLPAIDESESSIQSVFPDNLDRPIPIAEDDIVDLLDVPPEPLVEWDLSRPADQSTDAHDSKELSDLLHPLNVFTDALPIPEPVADVSAPVISIEPAPEPLATSLDLSQTAENESFTDVLPATKSSATESALDAHDLIVQTPVEEPVFAPTVASFTPTQTPTIDVNVESPVPITDLEHVDFSSAHLLTPEPSLDAADEDDTLPPLASLDELESEDDYSEQVTTPEVTPATGLEGSDQVLLEASAGTDEIDSADTVAEAIELEVEEPPVVSAGRILTTGRDVQDSLLEVIESADAVPPTALEMDEVLADVEEPLSSPADAEGADAFAEVVSDSESAPDPALTLETGDLTDDALLDTEADVDAEVVANEIDTLSDSTLGRELGALTGDSTGPLVEASRDSVPDAPRPEPATTLHVGETELEEVHAPGVEPDPSGIEPADVFVERAEPIDQPTTDVIGAAAATDLIGDEVTGAESVELQLPELIDLASLTDDADALDLSSEMPDFALPVADAQSSDPIEFEANPVEHGDLSEATLEAFADAAEVSTEAVGTVSATPSMDVIEQSPTPVVSTVVHETGEDSFEEVQGSGARIIPIEVTHPPGSISAMQVVTVTRPAWADIPPQLLSFDDDDTAPPPPRPVARVAPRAESQPEPEQGFDPFANVGANMEHFLGGVGIDLRPRPEPEVPKSASFGHVSVAFDAKPGWGVPEEPESESHAKNGLAENPADVEEIEEAAPTGSAEVIQQKPAPPPRASRPRAIPFSQKASPIDPNRTAAPAPSPAYSAPAKPTSPFDGLTVGSLGTAGAVRQTDVFFNMPTSGQAPPAGSSLAPTEPIPYAGKRVATAPVGREASVASGLPIAPPPGVAPVVVARRTRRLGVRELVGLMLLTLAVLCGAVYWLVPYQSTVVANVVYDNFDALGDGDRAWFMDRQEKIVGMSSTRDAAKKRLASISPETPAGFLGDTIAFERLTLPGKMKWAPDTGTLQVTATGDEGTAQSKRLTALLGAIYEANLSFVNDAEGVKKSIEQLRSAIDRSVRDKEELDRQIRDAQQVRSLAPDPQRIRALGDEVSRIETQAASTARRVRDLQAEFDRLTVAPGATGTGIVSDIAPTDPDLIKMRQELADLNSKLTTSRDSAAKQTSDAKQSLDTALDVFNKRASAAQDLMGASPELVRYVNAAQTMQAATKKITNELIESQQESVGLITDTRRKLDDINSKRRAERFKNDVELKQMQESLEFSRRKLNAATGSADSQLVDQKQLDELRATIEILKAQIQSRQEQVGEDKFDREMTATLESLIAQSQKRMEDNRKKYEGILDGLAKEFTEAAPAVEKLSAEQKLLAEAISKQAADVSSARKQYSDALASASTANQKEVEKAATEVKARIDARATELAEAGKKTTASRAEQERIRMAEQKQKELGTAKVASASAEVALKKAKDDLYDAQKLIEQAAKAGDRIADGADRLKTLTLQLTSQRDAFDAKKKEASRSVAPHKPASSDVVVKENIDPRPNIMMVSIGATCVVYSILIAMASHRKNPAPVRTPAAPGNGHAVNGHGKPHGTETEVENEHASV